MNKKRILFIGFEAIVVFVVVWLLIQNKLNMQQNERPFDWVSFLEKITLFILSFGTSLVFWKRQAWDKQGKMRYLCLFTGIFSLISLLIILAAVRFDDKNVLLLGLFIFFITSLLISTVLYFLTLQVKYVLLEFIKIIFLSAMVFGINLFSTDFVSSPYHSGETGLSILMIALFFGAIATITSLIINFSILKKQLRRKI